MSSDADARHRLFFALWPESEVREQIEPWARLAVERSGGRIVPPGNLHLTLLFLGEVSAAQREQALSIGASIRSPAFELSLDRIQTAGSGRVTWLGTGRPARMVNGLVREIYLRWSAALPQPLRSERFLPHVTLVRDCDPARRMPVLPVPPVRWPVREFALVESQLLSTGSHYSVLSSWRLA